MNCFQKFISLIFGTTCVLFCNQTTLLWIAFKSLYLWYSEQRDKNSKSTWPVVNCFQKFISLIFGTTGGVKQALGAMLWIAFKSLYLWYSEQLHRQNISDELCCELLSKVYIFDIRNNTGKLNNTPKTVVNCFQKFISLIFGTT